MKVVGGATWAIALSIAEMERDDREGTWSSGMGTSARAPRGPTEGDRYWAMLRAAIPLAAPWGGVAPAACSGHDLGSRGEQPELPQNNV